MRASQLGRDAVHRNPFSDAELARRLAAIRQDMAERGIDIAVFSVPESVFYLTGLDHWGYFAPHFLVVPRNDDLTLITRAMERVTIEAQVRNARFLGHSDSDSAAGKLIDLLGAEVPRPAERGRRPSHGLTVGLEEQGAGLTAQAGRSLRESVPGATFHDISGLSDARRLVKSDEEMTLLRRAARASDAAAAAAVAALRDGAREADVAAEALAAMTRTGGNPPGFGPFIRPDTRLGEEHTTWGEGICRSGERVFLELAGCVSRYHAPLGRLVHIGTIRDDDARMAEICDAAFDAVCTALRPGAEARDVYSAWQAVVDDAGLSHYRRHHCGYSVGIGFPPSWTGGNAVTGLRHDSGLRIETGMSFHILSWLMGTGRGDFFLSNCVLLGPGGAEVLTRTPAGPTVV
jgi:Xaa-Pro dipeptidase